MDFGVIYRTRWNGSQQLAKRSIATNGLNGWKGTIIGDIGIPLNFGETSNGLNGLAIDFDSSDPLHWY